MFKTEVACLEVDMEAQVYLVDKHHHHQKREVTRFLVKLSLSSIMVTMNMSKEKLNSLNTILNSIKHTNTPVLITILIVKLSTLKMK